MSQRPANRLAHHVEFAAHSDIGRVRERNEDAFAVCAERGWAVLADGMGGYSGGDVAAQMAVATALRRLGAEPAGVVSAAAASCALAGAVAEANAEILRAGAQRPGLAGMGATFVAAVFLPGEVVCAHIGDSRLYRLRDGRLAQLTRDHTMLQEQIDGGMMSAEDARRSRWRGLLTRGLGVGAQALPDVGVHGARAEDLFLLCSDGLTDMLDDDVIGAVLAAGGPLQARAEHLVELANLHGGRDNVSVIVARVTE